VGILGFFFLVNSAQISSRFYSPHFYSVWVMMLLFPGLLPFLGLGYSGIFSKIAIAIV